MISPTHQLTTIHDGVDEIIVPWWYRQALNFSVDEPHCLRIPHVRHPLDWTHRPSSSHTPLNHMSPRAHTETTTHKQRHTTPHTRKGTAGNPQRCLTDHIHAQGIQTRDFRIWNSGHRTLQAPRRQSARWPIRPQWTVPSEHQTSSHPSSLLCSPGHCWTERCPRSAC